MLLPFGRLANATYLLYGIGYIVPLLQRDLGISESTAGLHASAVAVGTLAAGMAGERYLRRFGETLAPRIATFTVAIAGLVLGLGSDVILTLAGAALFGVASGVLLAWINHRFSALGGRQAGVALARVSLVGLLAALVSPIAISAADSVGVNGRLAMLLPLPLVVVLEAAYWRRSKAGGGAFASVAASAGPAVPAPSRPAPRLPNAYWRAWLVLVVAIALEFTIVYWSASLIDLRTGVGTSEATTAAAAFVLGMIASRFALAAGIGTHAPRLRLNALALSAVIAGALVTWQATSVAISAVGLFVAGLGVGPIYPVGIAYALSLARDAPEAAAARTTLAAGVALIGAPFLLAVVAERIGLVNAWPLVAVAALVGIGLVLVTRRDARPA